MTVRVRWVWSRSAISPLIIVRNASCRAGAASGSRRRPPSGDRGPDVPGEPGLARQVGQQGLQLVPAAVRQRVELFHDGAAQFRPEAVLGRVADQEEVPAILLDLLPCPAEQVRLADALLSAQRDAERVLGSALGGLADAPPDGPRGLRVHVPGMVIVTRPHVLDVPHRVQRQRLQRPQLLHHPQLFGARYPLEAPRIRPAHGRSIAMRCLRLPPISSAATPSAAVSASWLACDTRLTRCARYIAPSAASTSARPMSESSTRSSCSRT